MVHYIDDLNHKIFDKHGIEKQSLIACEELGECIQAISKCVRGKKDAVENLTEEIADCLVLFEQLQYHYCIDASTINQKYFNKVIRQSKREGILNGDI